MGNCNGPIKKCKPKKSKILPTLMIKHRTHKNLPPPYEAKEYDDMSNINIKCAHPNGKMTPIQWSEACSFALTNDSWDLAKEYLLNHDVSCHNNLIEIACDRRYAKFRQTRKINPQHVEVCSMILKKTSIQAINRINPYNLPHHNKNNILMTEICHGKEYYSLDLIHLMIIHGINLQHRNNVGNDVLFLAHYNKDQKLIDLILFHMDYSGSEEERLKLVYPFFLNRI